MYYYYINLYNTYPQIWHAVVAPQLITHTFKIKDEGVEIYDCIEYSIPMGLLGRFVHFLWIKRKLDQIFDFRRRKIEEIFISDELSVSYSL